MRTRIFLFLFVLLAAAGTWYLTQAPAETPGTAGRNDRSGDPSQPVPVVAGTAERTDVPIYLTGLGSVSGFNTVTVRSRVDGRLDRVLFREGQEVKAGEVLAQIDPRPLQAAANQALAALHRSEAQLANARNDLQRFSQLAAQQFSSRQNLDTQKAQVAQLEASVEADRAALESARVQLGYTTITSPIDGRTGIRQIDAGNIIHAADPTGLVVVTQLDPISVIFTLPEANLLAVNDELARGPLGVTALARDTETVLGEGRLALVDNQIDPQTATVKLKATFPNEKHRLWPGQFVKRAAAAQRTPGRYNRSGRRRPARDRRGLMSIASSRMTAWRCGRSGSHRTNGAWPCWKAG